MCKQDSRRSVIRHTDRFFFCVGLIMLCSEIWKQLTLTFSSSVPSYNWWYFPFQLCSIPMYLLTVLPFVRSRKLRQAILCFLMSYGTLGGAAVFADTSGLHYAVPALTVHSYLWHIALILTGTCAARTFYSELRLCGREQAKQKKEPALPIPSFLRSTVLYLACCCIAVILNLALDRYGRINMFYLNPHLKMQQIIFRDLVPLFGNTAALLIYIAASVTGSFLLFLLWYLIFIRLIHR